MGRFAQDPPELRDILGEIVFLDKAVVPYLGKHFFLAENTARVLDKHQQGIKHLRRQRHRQAVIVEEPFDAIEPKTRKTVYCRGQFSHLISS